MKVKVSDLITEFLYKKGVRDVFMVSGGGVIHLNDSLGRSKLNLVCNHHEQAGAMAAEAYARIRDSVGVCVVTTGPGGTNAITGVMGGWLDSIPMLIISGQIRRETIGAGNKLRQLGDQEINIVDIVKPITKYAIMVKDPNETKYHLEKALFIAQSGRPGPVWIDVPLDIQGAFVEEKDLKSFDNEEIKQNFETNKENLVSLVARVIEKIDKSQRPILFIGNGVRLSGASKDLLELIDLLKIPVLSGFAGFDLISPKNKYFAGHPGTIGQRGANFVVQNSDLLLAVGTRLNIRMIGYNFETFARAAYKIIVDIDKAEIKKKTLKPDLKINYDAKKFIEEMIKQLKARKIQLNIDDWLKKAREWERKYPVVQKEYRKEKKYVNPYYFTEELSKHILPKDIVTLANATASICTYQALNFPQGTRIITNSGCAAMGYGLPAAIGACIANGKKKIICLEGDGSIQLNIQELQTIVYNKLPIKIFIYNNQGYVSIRLTQKAMFNGKFVGSSIDSGLSWPDMGKIAKAYGITFFRINNHREMPKKISKALEGRDPVICEIMASPDQAFLPKSASRKLSDGTIVSRPLEDMFPFLSKKELKKNMLIPLVDEK